ncbi:MAG: sulfatase-like hydrolase/transferase, partial [Patescibacteria group bacterium]|nr:sulfatase-like hydrolase/transferase [Patescibacteria group bacterium]
MVSWKHYLKALRLPLILVAIFLVQNFFFNLWVGLYPSPMIFSLLVASVTLGVIVYGPGALMNGVWRYVYLFGASVAVSALLVSQYVYFAYFGGFLQASALTYAGQAGAEWDTIATLISPQLLLFIVNILFVIGAFLVRHRTGFIELSVRKKERAFIAVVLATLIVLGYGFRIASSDNALRTLQHPVVALHEINSFTFSPNATVQEIGVGNYYLDDIVGFFLRNVPMSPQDIAFAEGILEQKKAAMTKEQYAGLAKGDNLIYVQVESLETADIGQSVAGQEITPNLNALARQGLYFDNYYTQIGPGNTADAEFSTLNSLYPLSNEVAFIAYPHNAYDALPGTLVKNGYHTYALHGDVSDFWNRANIYPSLGYQDEISKDDFTAIETGFPTLDDDDFLSQSAVKMQSFTAPFMATVITLSSHTPFDIPLDYQKLVFPANSTLTDRQKSYLESIHYTDASLGAFSAQLKKEGIYQKSVIAIFGDHGSFTDISSALGPS